jgi:fructosamine-3-kinase
MLRRLGAAGLPVPTVEAEFEDMLLLENIPSDGVFSARAWSDIGQKVARLHADVDGPYGWPTDFAIGTVQLDNREGQDWPRFWGEQRLASAASLLDRPWRERIDRLIVRLADHLPASPPPSLLHGDLWTGNLLVRGGRLAAFIDPACYRGDREVDLAMICLFGAPEPSFWESYGRLDAGWPERKALYQLFPALVHLRLFGGSYASLVDQLLRDIGA